MRGFAITGETGINVETVSSTQRGALVNWLVGTKGVEITVAWTDEQVAESWKSLRTARDQCVEVDIAERRLP